VTLAQSSKSVELVQKYAEAAYQLTALGWLDDLKAVRERLSAAPELLGALSDPEQPAEERQAQLDQTLPAGIRPDVREFLNILVREGHLGLLDGVITSINKLANPDAAAQSATVTAAVPFTREEQETFRQRLHSKYGDHLDVTFRVDSGVLGGVILQVGDKVVDGSLAGRLTALHDRLLAIH